MKKIILFAIIILAILLFFIFDFHHYFTLEYFSIHRLQIQELYVNNPLFFTLAYSVIYIAMVSLSLPGATIMTLIGGFLFGTLWGTILVSFTSTIGATIVFLFVRYLFQDYFKERYKSNYVKVTEKFTKDGVSYLVALRLIPYFPFFLVNILMGLTQMRTRTFYIVSQLSMIPGTLIYVNAGAQVSKIKNVSDILSLPIIISFALLGLSPFVFKLIYDLWKNYKLAVKYNKPKKFDYNVVVIGAGSGGLVAAYIAAALKAKVALIEKNKMGGDCLNTGCVPSKTLLHSAKIVSYIKRAKEFGLEPMEAHFNFAQIMERVQHAVNKIKPHDSIIRYTELGVDCIQGKAKILSPYEIEVAEKRLTTRNIIIATGARPLVPTIPGLDKIRYFTSDNIWELRTLPKRFVILGGGPIGCEMAQAFARLGSEVTIVEMLPRLMIREDVDVSDFISEKFKKEGINILTSHKVKSFRKDGNTQVVICEFNGHELSVEFDEVLLAFGRKAQIKDFGLEELGVEISKQGTITHDEFMQTNYSNIFVCGDVAGPYQFTHTAAHQAWYASVNSLLKPFKKFKVDDRVIPWCTFTDPEIARVGLNEIDAKEKGIQYQVTKYKIDDLDRAITEEEDHGFIKVLTQLGKDKILGATIVGPHAGDCIIEYVLAMKHGFGLNKILNTIHIYPTYPEANKYVAGLWKNAHKPEKILRLVEKFHSWRRS